MKRVFIVSGGLLGCDVLWSFRWLLTLKMEAIRSVETLVTTCNTTRCHSPEDQPGHLHPRENLKSQSNYWEANSYSANLDYKFSTHYGTRAPTFDNPSSKSHVSFVLYWSFQTIRPNPLPCVTFRNIGLLLDISPHSTTLLKNHLLSAIRYRYNLHVQAISIHNLRYAMLWFCTRKLSWKLHSVSGRVRVARAGVVLTVKKTSVEYTVVISDILVSACCELLY
jgi:hypothetical protein